MSNGLSIFKQHKGNKLENSHRLSKMTDGECGLTF